MNIFDYFENKHVINPIQRTLLASLTREKPINNQHFLTWLATVDFDALDYPSFRLIPAVFDQFRDVKEVNPYYGKMKGIYRYHSVLNAMMLTTGRSIFKKFIDAKIDFILFKGAALILKYYQNHSIRPMGDIDFLIHERDVLEAEKILIEHNLSYRYDAARREAFNEHSLDYIDTKNNGYDLHWYALYESIVPGIDRGIWERAVPFLWDGLPVKVMAPEDLIFTSCINGVRESPMRFEWINDVIKVIQVEPSLSWDTIYREAKNRNLCEPFFSALHLIHGLSQKSIPATRLNNFLVTNREYKQALLSSLKSEGRTYGINRNKHKFIQKLQAKWSRYRSIFQKKNQYDHDAVQHIRYFFDEEYEINLLYLHYKHLPAINDLFAVEDFEAFTAMIQQYPTTGEGYVKIAPGMLKLKSNFQLPEYRASIQLLDTDPLLLSPGEKRKIKLRVQNHARYLWIIPNQSNINYAVSYHLWSDDGTLIAWDFPRTRFLEAKKNYVTFMGLQGLEVKLEISAPSEPGDYKIYFDIVHEGITWFSEHGNAFPALTMKVMPANR